MAESPRNKAIPTLPEYLSGAGLPTSFPGFKHLSANFTYTPNQFFDVCLPHYSRGVVRLVAYMIRQTLGYCDADGRPQVQRVSVSYGELVEHVGIARGAIREALTEALEGKFLRCVQSGSPNRNGQRYTNAAFELRWDRDSEYLKDPKKFKGFYEGEGNRTDIPNQFFDVIVPNETLALIKVVGSILRFSIGFQTRQGGRRQQVALSYKDIQNYARMGSPRHLSNALQEALETGYITRIEDGFFDPNRGKGSKAATYSLRWETTATYQPNGSKREAGNPTGERFKKGSGDSSKREAAQWFKKGSDIQTKARNKTSKQQQPNERAVAAEDLEAYKSLTSAGFDETSARRLAVHPVERINQQIEWLSRRGAKLNPLGLLRRAIEENWPEPVSKVETSQLSADSPAALFAKYFYAAWGGNQESPTAEPSTTDLATAQGYVERLLADWPNPSLAPKWGTAFGRLCLAKTEGRRPAIVSFAAMLRSYGDEFFVRNHQAKAHELTAARDAARAERERERKPRWVEYLLAAEQELQATRSEAYEAFEAWRLAERKKFEEIPGTNIRQRALQSFDSTESRLKAFREFFADDVLDFWAWDAQTEQALV